MNRKHTFAWLAVVMLAVTLGTAVFPRSRESEESGSLARDPATIPRDGHPDAAAARSGKPGRTAGPGAKLRSLLEVREGEIAAVAIPPEAMTGLAAFHADDDGERPGGSPRLIGVFSRESLLSALEHSPGVGGGSIDNSQESFELSAGRMTISGSAHPFGETVRLNLTISEGANAIECLTRVPEGGVILVRSAGESRGGVLIAVGQPDKSAANGE